MDTPKKRTKYPGRKHLPKGLMVLYEDDDLLVVDKPAGMLTIGTDREKVRTVYYALTDYVRKGNPKSRARVFIVHRLDRETSGVVVFAKNERVKRALQDHWEQVRKEYLAAVEGVPKKARGSMTGYLLENQSFRVYPTSDSVRGKFARTDYEVVAQTPAHAILAVTIETGRKHQIRVHLAEMGHPVVGDRKYGSEKQDKRRLALHSLRVTLTHPTTRERLTFSAPVPELFARLVPGWGGPEEPGPRGDKPPRQKSSEEGVEVAHHGRRRTRKNTHRRRAGSDSRRGSGDAPGEVERGR